MKKESVYIIGKIGDLSDDDYCDYVMQKFAMREKSLHEMGFEVKNPMRLVPRNTEWADAMKICIPVMLSCDKVSPLPDTWISNGGMIEFDLSRILKMPIIIPTKEEITSYDNNTGENQGK